MKLARLRTWGCRLREMVIARSWFVPLVLSVLLSLVLIERKHGLLTNSFLTESVLSAWEIPVFLFLTVWIDFTLIQTLLLPVNLLARFFRLSARVYSLLAISLATAFVVTLNVVVYRVARYLGDVCHIPHALDLGAGEGAWSYLAPLLKGEVLILVVIWLLIGLGSLFYWRVSRGGHSFFLPSLRGQLILLAVFWSGLLGIELMLTRFPAHSLASHLQHTCLQKLASKGFSYATDWDRDGFGWIDTPVDFAPFDSDRQPFAIDIPHNGLDENGLAGDLTRLAPERIPVPRPKPLSKPDVVLIVACSLRPEVVFGGELGPSVMPNLRQLAGQGFATSEAYSHTGSTKTSIPNIYCGSIDNRNQSLVRDFKALGYRVAIFSTQDDHFAGIFRLCGFKQADKYFGAGQAPEARVTDYSVLASLMISSERVIEELSLYLNDLKQENNEQPLFLGIHLFTTHFPYTHDSPEDLIPHTSLPTRDISPARRADLVQVYRNAAANLDLQVSQVLDAVHAFRPNSQPVILFVADHGESLFDDGMLGHGLVIDDAQTRVPCILAGGWGEIETPLGHADLRGVVLRMLATPRTESSLQVRLTDRAIFQYTGQISSPAQIAHRTSTDRVLIDFQRGVCVNSTGGVIPLSAVAEEPEGLRLINDWESIRYHESSRKP